MCNVYFIAFDSGSNIILICIHQMCSFSFDIVIEIIEDILDIVGDILIDMGKNTDTFAAEDTTNRN